MASTSIINTSRIAIVGLGQLGGSLALRLDEIKCRSLYAISRNETTIKDALERGILEGGSTDAADILPVVDMTFICLPLTASIEFVKANIDHFRPGSIVTDVGSVKVEIVREIRGILLDKGVYFVGGHPMAGSEKSGWENCNAELYQNAIVFLTPTPDDESLAIDLVRNFWQDIGARPLEIEAERHDEAVAYTSHFIHLLSSAICKTVFSSDDNEARELACAGAFRDTTRIASSNVNMWTEITKYNHEFIKKALADFKREIDSIDTYLNNQDWDNVENYFADAKSKRDNWFNK